MAKLIPSPFIGFPQYYEQPTNAGPYLPDMFPYESAGRPAIYKPKKKAKKNGKRRARRNSSQRRWARQRGIAEKTYHAWEQPSYAHWTSYPTYAYEQYARSNRSAAIPRYKVGLKRVPKHLKRTSRRSAEGLYAVGKKFPIGDLYHARLAMQYSMFPSNAKYRARIRRAVKAAYPEYNWDAWWKARWKGAKKNTKSKSKSKSTRDARLLPPRDAKGRFVSRWDAMADEYEEMAFGRAERSGRARRNAKKKRRHKIKPSKWYVWADLDIYGPFSSGAAAEESAMTLNEQGIIQALPLFGSEIIDQIGNNHINAYPAKAAPKGSERYRMQWGYKP